MKKLITLLSVATLSFAACNESQKAAKVEKTSTAEQKSDSIKNDELTNAVKHEHLVFEQRATIRPVYQEIEKDKSAVHDGYVINLRLKNNTKTTTYKDIEIEINYFTNPEKLAGQEKILVKDAVKPGDTLITTRPVKQFKNTSYLVKLIAAKGI